MDLHTFFEHEVKPALGCTEPGAVAYAASAAAARITSEPRHIHLRLSANMYKNGPAVGIPGTNGLKGNLLAAALGVLGGEANKGLLALENISLEIVARAEKMLEGGQITQEVVPEVPNVYAEVELLCPGESVTAIVAHAHDTLAEIRHNGTVVHRSEDAGGALGAPAYIRDLARMEFSALWEAAGTIDDGLEKFLLEGASMNMAAAEAGTAKHWGLGVGHRLAIMAGEEIALQVKAFTGGAADVRMAGGSLPVMSSGGSGNHGLVAIIPATLAARKWGKSDRELAEALALSHLVTGGVKAKTGRLTPVCGCTVAAGAGAAAALTRLAGGTAQQAESATAYLIAALMGMICDGAKPSCALKVSTAAGEAWTSAMLALHEQVLTEREGIVGPDFQANARAVGELSSIGFSAVDGTVIRIMKNSE